jgi:hypothetical protein
VSLLDYQYDIFLSYKSDSLFTSWVKELFRPLLTRQLTEELGRPLGHFLDSENILSGQDWSQELRLALARSRCVVAVWHPFYFHSRWCRAECRVMLKRAKSNDHGTPSRSAALVHAVKVHDGESFPDWAKSIQHQDFTRFAYTGPAFVRTKLYLELEKAMWRLAKQIAAAIKNSPPWNSEWIEAELTDDVFDDGFRPPGPADAPPTLG